MTIKTIKKILLNGLFSFITTILFAGGTGSIYNNQQEIMTYEVKDPTHHNINDGSIEINIIDGNNYSFSWDNGMDGDDIYNLSNGVFRVKIETPQGEIIWASFTINPPEQLQDTFSGIENLDLNGIGIEKLSKDVVYDLSGKQVILENSPSGMYLIVNSGVVVNKIIK